MEGVFVTEKLDLILGKYRKMFEKYWEATLRTLHTSQSQLVMGNRFRPQLVLLGYLANFEPTDWENEDFALPAKVAVSIELIHKASLLLDDWIDDDTHRHGALAFHMENSPKQTVIMAIKMVGLSTYRLKEIFSSSPVLPQNYYLCLDKLIDIIYSMAEGAYQELSLGKEDLYNFETVRDIAMLETAEIIGNSLLLGFYCSIGEKSLPEIEHRLKVIGDQCGYIFQVMNDMEVFSKPLALKEHKGSLNYDVAAKHKNLVIASLYQIASKRDCRKLEHADEIELQALVNKYNIIQIYLQELDVEFASLIMNANELSSMGVSGMWCDLFKAYLYTIRKNAQARL